MGVLAIAVCTGWLIQFRAEANPGFCARREDSAWRTERTEYLGPHAGQASPIWLCLARHEDYDLYAIALAPVEARGTYTIAQRTAAERLQAIGVDPCRVVWWSSGPHDLGLDWYERQEPPIPCGARIMAGDDAATAWLPTVEAVAAKASAWLADAADWHTTRPVTVMVVTSPAAAHAVHERLVYPRLQGTPAEVAELRAGYADRARQGSSPFTYRSQVGDLIVLNVARHLHRDPAEGSLRVPIESAVAHEYTHFLQHVALGSGLAPVWFKEGQAMWVADQVVGHGGQKWAVSAALRQLPGAPRLRDLGAPLAEPFWGDEYVHGHPTVALLVERHGFPATVQVLRDSRGHSLDDFEQHLAELTRMDLDELDDALGAWLRTAGRLVFREQFARSSGYLPRTSNGTMEAGQVGSEYAVVKRAGTGRAAWQFLLGMGTDFLVEVGPRMVAPTPGSVVYLVVDTPTGSGARVGMDPVAAAFTLEYSDEGGTEQVLDWTRSPAILPGAAVNRLTVLVREPDLILTINDATVASVTVAPGHLPGGGGLIAVSVVAA